MVMILYIVFYYVVNNYDNPCIGCWDHFLSTYQWVKWLARQVSKYTILTYILYSLKLVKIKIFMDFMIFEATIRILSSKIS